MVLVGVSLPYPTSFKNQFSHSFFLSVSQHLRVTNQVQENVFFVKNVFFYQKFENLLLLFFFG